MATERDTSKSWWSNHHHQASNHLVELQKEIKEEEEEIFADINSLINSRSNLYSTYLSDDCDEDNNDTGEHNVVAAAAAITNSLIEEKQNFLSTYNQKPIIVATPTPTPTITQAPTQATTTISGTTTTKNTTTTTTTTTTINNNNISHYRRRLDEQLFYSDDSEEEDLLPNRYKSRASKTVISVASRRDFHSNSTAASGGGARPKDADNEEASTRDYMDHFDIDSGPPPEEVDFMHQDPYLDGSITVGRHHHGHLTSENEIIEDEDEDADDDDPNYTSGHKYSVANQISQENYQALQAVIQHVTSNLPKPCVFYLEGNCRRSDCKYSHDLSNITCKYWIEGFCFKGEMCPFLHSYNPPLDPSDPNCLDEEGLLLGKKELNPTFAIESEADFPSLPLDAPASTLNDSTKSSSNADSLTGTIKDQIMSSNPAVVFKTVKKKRKKG